MHHCLIIHKLGASHGVVFNSIEQGKKIVSKTFRF